MHSSPPTHKAFINHLFLWLLLARARSRRCHGCLLYRKFLASGVNRGCSRKVERSHFQLIKRKLFTSCSTWPTLVLVHWLFYFFQQESNLAPFAFLEYRSNLSLGSLEIANLNSAARLGNHSWHILLSCSRRRRRRRRRRRHSQPV